MNKLFACMLIAAALVGCASPAEVGGMVAKRLDTTKIAANTQTKSNISLTSVSGGTDTNPLWMSKVSDADFKAALETSLKDAMLLSGSVDNSKYTLDVKLIKLEQPLFGLDLKVTASAEYTLKAKSSGLVVWTKVIETPFTATFSDAAVAIKRMRLANEGAVRSNIEQVIDALLAVNPDQPAVATK